MHFKHEIITNQGSFIIEPEKQLSPKILFKQKKNLEYPKFQYKNQSLDEILQNAKNKLIEAKTFRNEEKTWTTFQKIFANHENIENPVPYRAETNIFELHDEDETENENGLDIEPKSLFKAYLSTEISHQLMISSLNLTGYFHSETATDEDCKKWAKFLEFIYYNHFFIRTSFCGDFQKQIELISSPYYKKLSEEVKSFKTQDMNISSDYIINKINDLANHRKIIFPKIEIDNYFLTLAKDTKIAEFWNKYGDQIVNKGIHQFDNEFEVDKNIINDFTYYIMNHLESIVKANILAENTFFENIQYDKEFIDFKTQYKMVEPLIKVLFNTNNILKSYYIEFHSILEKYQDERKGAIKPFLAAGQCFYDFNLFMNTDNIKDHMKWGKTWAKTKIEEIFLHEAGHAIDYACRKNPNILLISTLNNTRISQHSAFKKLTICAYKNTRGYNYKQQKIVDYYVYPRIITEMNSTVPVQYNWSRAYSESFAESFAIISGWLINGFTKADTYTIQGKKSKNRIKIKTLMRLLYFVLDYCNWEYLGVSPRTLRNRKRMIKQFLNKLENLPLVLKNSKYDKGSKKIHTYKKPILRKLITNTYKESL